METKITPEYQESIFNEISRLQYKLRHLSSYIQNDFEDMLKNKQITKEDIEEGVLKCNDDFDNFIETIQSLKEKTLDIMLHYTK